jgi:hypothetical protein
MTLEINFLKIRSNEQLIKNYYRHYSRSKMWWIFLPPIFCSFFFVFAQVSSKKHTRAREETHYYAQKDKFLFAQ